MSAPKDRSSKHGSAWAPVILSTIVGACVAGACGGNSAVVVVARADAAGPADGATDRARGDATGRDGVDARDADVAASLRDGAVDTDGDGSDGPVDGDATATMFCARGVDVAGVTPPAGFCLKHFTDLGEARTLVFAPNGDLFVAAPSMATPGGASGGLGAIVILTDDDHDGVAEQHPFMYQIDAKTPLVDVHGLALGGGYLYFTTQATVWRTPYTDGQRTASGTVENLGLPTSFGTGGRWTHGLARSTSGRLLASRGAFAQCGATPGGEISSVGAAGALTTVASGLRNPMYMRCHAKDDVCAAMELGEDLEAGATEKMVVIRSSTSYGYPCCFDEAVPAPGADMACGDVTLEDATFPLSDTPFGFDWEPGAWPTPFRGAIFVALHGSAYSSPLWKGVGIVYAPTNATTHVPTQDWQMFLGGFGPAGSVLKRPADVAFAPDGRLFFADDTGGHIYWMAPVGPSATTP